MEFLTLVAYALVTIFMTKLHVGLTDIGLDTTTRVAEKFAVRSHKLIEQGVMIDLMPYSFDKHVRYTDWTFELHEYLDEFEEELREAAKEASSAVILIIPTSGKF